MKNALLLACASWFIAFPAAWAAGKPNILFIVADDMGYADCGVQGCQDVPTPHLDALARGGVRFTDGYVTGTVCSPTRAGLMTGRYHYRDGVFDWIPPGKPGLDAGVPTIASYLGKAGYRTAIVGKWHLGEAESCWPTRRGFDEFFGFLGGGRSYFPDKAKGKGAGAKPNLYTQILRGTEPVVEKEYTTHAFGREAAAFITRQKGRQQPFFLYLAFNAVHTPMEAPEGYASRFAGITDPKRRTYAGMLTAMDEDIGRVLAALRERGMEDDTLVCFHSDNGGPITRNAPNASINTPLRGGKGETWEGGVRVPMFLRWPGQVKAGTTFSRPVIQMDLTATALALAGVTPDARWPLDGVNLLPFLNGAAAGDPHAVLGWKYEAQWAIRQGKWKLAYAGPAKGEKAPRLGLYDLSQDVSESRDLSASEPARVKELQSAWESWRADVIGNRPVLENQTKGR